MSKVRKRLIILLSVILFAALALGVALGVLPSAGVASAAPYLPTSIFSQGTGGDVLAGKAAGEDASYITFSFRDEGSVYYRRNLALKWYDTALTSSSDTGSGVEGTAFTPETDLYDAGKVQYFSMQFSFAPAEVSTATVNGAEMNVCPRCGANFAIDATVCPTCNFSTAEVIFFDRYEIKFESAEENISKDAKATNSIVFKPGEAGALQVGIKNAGMYAAEKDDTVTTDEDAGITFATIEAAKVAEEIAISFTEDGCSVGEFAVQITVGGTAVDLGENNKFTNIGGNFLEYRSSASSTPSTPITFHTELAAAAEGQKAVNQRITMKSLNGQGFVLDSENHVTDDTPAVLVVNEEVYAFTLGQRYSLSTEAIDVCDDSVSVVRSYYMLRGEKDDAALPHIPDVTASTDYATLTTSTYLMPADDADQEEEQYVSIRYILRDGRFTNDSDYDYVYLTWYAAADKDVVKSFKNGDAQLDFIKVIREKEGPYYLGITANEDTKVNDVDHGVLDDAVKKYQDDLKTVAENTSVGSGTYIYLPSFRGLISSDYADYRNLRFSIFYKKENSSSSASSETSLRYNNLRFQVDTEGRYAFKVLASDAAGNTMKMYVDEELVDVTSSNIWDIEEIPTFTFEGVYTGADIEQPGEQDTASRGSLYTIKDFEIHDLGDSTKEYELYYLDFSDEETPDYSELVEAFKTEEGAAAYADRLDEIRVFNGEIDEEDEEWERTDNDYHWDPESDLSFVPQKSGFYVVKLMHYDMHKTDAEGLPAELIRYQVIEVRNPYDYIPTTTNWFANNVTSVVLFSISAVLAVIIVVLFVVKPSDKKVEEVDLEKLKGKKKSKK